MAIVWVGFMFGAGIVLGGFFAFGAASLIIDVIEWVRGGKCSKS